MPVENPKREAQHRELLEEITVTEGEELETIIWIPLEIAGKNN